MQCYVVFGSFIPYCFSMRQFICIAIAGAAIAGSAIVAFFQILIFYYCTCILNWLKSHKLWFWQLSLVPQLYDVILNIKKIYSLAPKIAVMSCHKSDFVVIIAKDICPRKKKKYSGKLHDTVTKGGCTHMRDDIFDIRSI